MSRTSERRGFVYVLHFDSPLKHATHYVGCTEDIAARLLTHAQGRGAKIVRALLAEGKTFRLGGLGCTSVARMRRLERQTKNWHGGQAFCEVCHGEDRGHRIPGCEPVSLKLVKCPTLSSELWPVGEEPPTVRCRVTSPADPLSLGLAMGRMMQQNKDALGFIPTGGDKGINRSIAAGQVVVAEVDGQLVGYVQWTDANTEHVRIHQCVVSDVWRGSGIGRQMIEVVRAVRPGRVLTCRVRDDLSANEFWARVGFDRIGQETHETSGAPINLYQCGEVEGG